MAKEIPFACIVVGFDEKDTMRTINSLALDWPQSKFFHLLVDRYSLGAIKEILQKICEQFPSTTPKRIILIYNTLKKDVGRLLDSCGLLFFSIGTDSVGGIRIRMGQLRSDNDNWYSVSRQAAHKESVLLLPPVNFSINSQCGENIEQAFFRILAENPPTNETLDQRIAASCLRERFALCNFSDGARQKRGFVDERGLFFVPDRCAHGQPRLLRGESCGSSATSVEQCILEMRHELGGMYRFGMRYVDQQGGVHYHIRNKNGNLDGYDFFCQKEHKTVRTKQQYVNVYPNDYVRL